MRRIFFFFAIALIGLAILVSLGVWQVQRLAWKEALLADIDARISGAPGPLPTSPDPVEDRYRPVEISGEMLADELHVLVSRKRVGAGYRIIAPFRTGDRTILIDRGFVPTADKDVSRAIGLMTVSGNLHWPDEVDGFTPEPDIAGNIWFARDVQTMADALEAEPVLVILRSQTDPAITPLPVDTAGIPNDHLHYAVTWFGLALVWLAMTIFFLRRNRARTRS
ncbi:SURF1 family protein [Lutimaribacter marinistellae]|uniref:SURF1-like protein n=1 Tax=Lutimaribacter marinistellae TaxID=1820329 RepID=A0ABV7TEL5_9RHOB